MEQLLAHPLATPLWNILPHLPSLLRAWGTMSLGDMAARFVLPGDTKVSPALLHAVQIKMAPILGENTAKALSARLQASPAVLSANYHCVECYPEMVQALHFFALPQLLSPAQTGVDIVPVVSCGSVSLQSPTYPRGLMLTRTVANKPVRLPFFSSRYQDVMACRAPALTANALQTMRSLWYNKDHPALQNWEQAAVNDIVDQHMLTAKVLELPNFCTQTTRINASLCAARYPDALHTQVVYLEMEGLVAELLKQDMMDSHSVISQCFFDAKVRDRVTRNLTGVRGCWQTEALQGMPLGRTGCAGTVFFWMVDAQGRRCPLSLNNAWQTTAALHNQHWTLPLQPQALGDALEAGTIVPSLFTTYISLCLDHGLRCFGGIFLADYLPAMIDGTLAALNETGGFVPTWEAYNPLAALPLSVQIRVQDELLPAGGVELHAAGGLSQADIKKISQLTVTDVLPASLAAWYQEYIPLNSRPAGWKKELSALAGHWTGVVVTPQKR